MDVEAARLEIAAGGMAPRRAGPAVPSLCHGLACDWCLAGLLPAGAWLWEVNGAAISSRSNDGWRVLCRLLAFFLSILSVPCLGARSGKYCNGARSIWLSTWAFLFVGVFHSASPPYPARHSCSRPRPDRSRRGKRTPLSLQAAFLWALLPTGLWRGISLLPARLAFGALLYWRLRLGSLVRCGR